MSLVFELGKLLESNGFGIVGQDIFGLTKPDQPNNIILIMPNGGSPTEIIREQGIQILIRDEDAEVCDEKSNSVYEFLRNLENFDLGNFYVYAVEPTSDLIPLGYDNKNRYEISMNFNFVRR